MLWKRAKTIAITTTKTTSTISHARNRHLIVPSRTSGRRRTKEEEEATSERIVQADTRQIDQSNDEKRLSNARARREMTIRIPRWISSEGKSKMTGRSLEWLIYRQWTPMVDNTWEISTSLMIIKWNESSQKRIEKKKMNIRPMMIMMMISRFLLARRHTVKSTRQWDEEAEAAMLTLSSWKISLQLQDEALRQIRTIGPNRVKDSWWSNWNRMIFLLTKKTKGTRQDEMDIWLFPSAAVTAQNCWYLVSWHLFVD